jgi:ribosome-associated protein YbcJ (S4-like RNA binding protein)
MVFRNGEVETRRRAKIIKGDTIEISDNVIVLA